MRRMAIAAVLVALFAIPTLAQNPPQGTTTRVRGVVDKLDGQTLTVKSREGDVVTIALAPDVAIQTLVKKSLADIKPGDFVASTGIKDKDGKIHAIEVRIFPTATPDGGRQFAWDLGPDSVMTNATVGTVTKAPEGMILHVTFGPIVLGAGQRPHPLRASNCTPTSMAAQLPCASHAASGGPH